MKPILEEHGCKGHTGHKIERVIIHLFYFLHNPFFLSVFVCYVQKIPQFKKMSTVLSVAFSKIQIEGCADLTLTFRTEKDSLSTDEVEQHRMVLGASIPVQCRVADGTLFVKQKPTSSNYLGNVVNFGNGNTINSNNVFGSNNSIYIGGRLFSSSSSSSSSSKSKDKKDESKESKEIESKEWKCIFNPLQNLDVSGTGSVVLNGSITYSEKLNISVYGSRKVKFPKDTVASSVSTNLCGSSSVKFNGLWVDEMETSVSGSATLEGFHVESQLDASASGAGQIKGTASAHCAMDKTKSGAGEINIPRQ